jgi:murein DD-endopeptidase MepM/ murein hydrolase activator NlpD
MVRLAPGETLLSLSKRYGVSVAAIARVNGLRGGPILPGTTLYIPAAEPSKFAQAPAAPRAKVAECSGSHCYTVQRGETIGAIARSHGVTEQQLLEANNLPNARALKAGQSIAIPGDAAPRQAMAPSAPPAREAQRTAGHVSASAEASSDTALQQAEQARPSTPVKMTTAKQLEPSCEAALANPVPRMGRTFRKPVEGLVIGQFGPQRDGTVNEGLTISVPKGTPIKAAENGVVAYVGDELPGFGNLILIRHAEEYVTAYAHADEIMVKKCDVVKRGQTIATAGATGDASQPQLHFEIRKNAKPVDPAPLLGS